MRTRKFGLFVLTVSALALPLAAGCAKTQTVQGIIQTLDLSSGAFSVRVTTGEYVDLVLDRVTRIDINGRQVTPNYLEPGLAAQVQARGKTATLIEVNLAQAYATIVAAADDKLTVQPADAAQPLTLKLKPFSRVSGGGDDGSARDLVPGRIALVYFCTATGTAYEVDQKPAGYQVPRVQTGTRIEGVVTRYRLDQVNIVAVGGLARGIWLDDKTELVYQDGTPATREDIYVWDWVTLYYDPKTVIASYIEIRPDSQIREKGPINAPPTAK